MVCGYWIRHVIDCCVKIYRPMARHRPLGTLAGPGGLLDVDAPTKKDVEKLSSSGHLFCVWFFWSDLLNNTGKKSIVDSRESTIVNSVTIILGVNYSLRSCDW